MGGAEAHRPETGLRLDTHGTAVPSRQPPCPRPGRGPGGGAGLTLAAVLAVEAGPRAVAHGLVVHHGAHAPVEAHPALALVARLARAPAAAAAGRLVVQPHLAAVHGQGRGGVDPHVADPAPEGRALAHGGQRELERRGAQFRRQPAHEQAAEHRHVPPLGLDLHPLGLRLVDDQRGVAELAAQQHAVPGAVVDRRVGQQRGGLGAEDGEAELQAAAARQDELQEVAEALVVEVEHEAARAARLQLEAHLALAAGVPLGEARPLALGARELQAAAQLRPAAQQQQREAQQDAAPALQQRRPHARGGGAAGGCRGRQGHGRPGPRGAERRARAGGGRVVGAVWAGAGGGCALLYRALFFFFFFQQPRPLSL